mgnify:FL=1
MLGRQVAKVFRNSGKDVISAGRSDADVGNLSELRSLFDSLSPDLVIHCAAFTDVDGCEQDPERAFRVNSMGSRNVAQVCAEVRAKLLYVSSDYVFDGSKGSAYREFDAPNPLNVYGQSKYEGEFYVSRLCRRFIIIRTSWLFGPGGANFVSAICDRARRGEEIRVVDDQIGSPTYTLHLAKAMLAIVDSGVLGLFHVSGQGRCSWYGFAQKILEMKSFDKVPLTPIFSSEVQNSVSRPSFSVLENFNLKIEGLDLPPHWSEGLAAYLGEDR